MSHIVTIKTEVRDAAALRAACARLKVEPPVQGKFTLFASTVSGLGVKLPGWQYPVVCNTTTGDVHYDHYGERWGEEKHLDALKQAYAVEKAKIEARKKGCTVMERTLADGTVKLTVTGGAL